MATVFPHYSIDTSSLIRWYVEDYSPDVFEGLPDRLSQLVVDGRLRAVRSIGDIEIKDSDDPHTLAKWCKAQNGFYVEEEESIQVVVKDLMATFQNPKKKSGISGSDPFVIAHAKVSGVHWHVVSEEALHNGSAAFNPNIPFVCNAIGVNPISFLDMLRMEGWKLK